MQHRYEGVDWRIGISVFTTGIPKSGNTWLNNLLCDILKARHQDTETDFAVYMGKGKFKWKYVVRKVHMPYDPEIPSYDIYPDIVRTLAKSGYMFMIYRDPRAQIISASHFKNEFFDEGLIWRGIKSACDSIGRYEKWNRSYFDHPENCSGIVKYEDMLKDTKKELRRLLKIMGERRTDKQLDASIERQSFKVKTKEAPKFYWKGKADTWKQYFNREMAEYLDKKLGNFLIELGYEKDHNWIKEFK